MTLRHWGALSLLGGSFIACSASHPVGEETGALCPSPANPSAGDLKDVAGTADRDLWAVGQKGGPWHFDGERWSAAGQGTTLDLSGLWAGPDGTLWAVGSGTLTLSPGTGGWRVEGATHPLLYDVAGNAGGEVWAVGVGGTVLRREGNAWAPVAAPSGSNLFAVWVFDSGEVWVGGTQGALFRREGDTWRSDLPPDAPRGVTFTALWGTPDGTLWVTDEVGDIFERTAGRWTRRLQGSIGAAAWYGLWGANGPEDRPTVWAVGEGRALRWDGSRWDDAPLVGTAVTLLGMTGEGNARWAVGHGGALFSRCFP